MDKHELGEAMMFEFDDGSEGEGGFPNHAILHTYELIDGSTNTVLKLLVAENTDTAMKMLAWCEMRSREMGKRGIFLRSYQGTGLKLADFLKQGYALAGVQVRMMIRGEEENTNLPHISCWSG